MNAKVSLSRKDELFLIDLGLKSVLASVLHNPNLGIDRPLNGHKVDKKKWTPERRRRFKATIKAKREKERPKLSAATRRKLSASMKKRWKLAKQVDKEL